MRTWLTAFFAAALLSSAVFAAAEKSVVNEEIVIPAKSAQARQFTLERKSTVRLSVAGKENADKGLRVYLLGGAGQWEKFRLHEPVAEVEAFAGVDVKTFSHEADLEPGQYTLIVQNSNNVIKTLTALVQLGVTPIEAAPPAPVVAPTAVAPPNPVPPAVVASADAAATPIGLCKAGETSLLLCNIKGSTKIASLCGSPDLGKSTGTMVYRFGKPDHVEMEYPDAPAHPSKAFHYSPWSGSGGMGSSEIFFTHNGYDYSFTWSLTKGVEDPVTLSVSTPQSSNRKPIELKCGAGSSTSYDFSTVFTPQ